MKDGAVAGRVRRGLATLLLDIGDQDGNLAIGKLLGDARADQRGSAGDDRYLVGQTARSSPPHYTTAAEHHQHRSPNDPRGNVSPNALDFKYRIGRQKTGNRDFPQRAAGYKFEVAVWPLGRPSLP